MRVQDGGQSSGDAEECPRTKAVGVKDKGASDAG